MIGRADTQTRKAILHQLETCPENPMARGGASLSLRPEFIT